MDINIDKFWVIAVISNPVRFNRRYELYNQFEHHIRLSGVNLLVVETQQGDRPFQVTDSKNPFHLQLRTFDELWIKERMVNLGIQRLPSDWEYVAWIDADIEFVRKDWARETVHQLQHYMIVQMFSQAIDLGPNLEPLQTHQGFVKMYHENFFNGPQGAGYGGYYQPTNDFWHPGYCWAARREAIDSLGGLFDTAILGAGDHHMALSLIGRAKKSVPKNIGEKYLNEILIWEQRAEVHLKRDIGFVPTTILHYWHGKKKDRKYVERWDIITKNNFDPDDDLKTDWQGLWELEVLTDRQRRLRDEIRGYFRARNEDSIDL